MRRKKRRERLNWFPPAEAALKRTLIHNIILVLLGSRPSGGLASCLQWRRWLPLISQLLPLTSLHFLPFSSLANSCRFLVGVWRIIKDLTRFALAMVPGRRRKALFLVWLRNKRIFSLRFLCLSYNAHDSGGIFCSRK